MTGDDYDRRLTENIGQPFSYRFIKEDYEDYSIFDCRQFGWQLYA